MEFYRWKGYQCAYETIGGLVGGSIGGSAEKMEKMIAAKERFATAESMPALLLIHPIGVGLSRDFWSPFIQQCADVELENPIYNLDLLGCGDSDMPQQPYRPQDWAEQIAYFIETVAKGPVVLVVQGALLPVAVKLMKLPEASQVKGMVLSGPPAWPLMTAQTPEWKTKLAWSLFASPLGNAFYRYARRESFLESFSRRQLFGSADDVTTDWLAMLHEGSRDMNSRYAVFSFLAGFWRQDYSGAIARIQQPVLIVMGAEATTIDRKVSKKVDQPVNVKPTPESNQKRLQAYLDHFPRAQGVSIPGRNVLPYESTKDFVDVVASFLKEDI
ncbi:MAG: alpha/beta hydrolase [Cyanobacteria bacterium J06643_4]